MMDAIDLLLDGKQHPDAQKLRNFHHANRDFLPRVAAEIRLLKRLGRKAGGVNALIHFLRWERAWHGVDEFEINDHLAPLAARLCTILWPDLNGMMQFVHCNADDILGTRIARRGKRYGKFLYPGKGTLNPSGSFLPIEKESAGLARPIRWGTAVTNPPHVPTLDRPSTFHSLITESEALSIAGPLRHIVDSSPNPRHPILRAWLGHVEAQPEIYAFMERTLLKRRAVGFSAKSVLEYCRWSIRRAAESDKQFTLPSRFDGIYCRALIMRNPEFNGYCKFKSDGKNGRANQLLGTSLAIETMNGEPYRRLVWDAVER